MPRRSTVPDALRTVPFTAATAARHGVTARMLRGPNYVGLFHGTFIAATVQLTIVTWIRAALLVLPLDSAVSHVTALWLYGVEIGPAWPLNFSTNSTLVTKHVRLRLHRRRGRLTSYGHRDLPVLGPDRTFVDAANQLSFVQLIQAAEMLLHAKLTKLEDLWEFALSRHIDGVCRARRVLVYVREKVESPMETLVRLMIVFARLPEPDCNPDILDRLGNFVARGDLVYFRWKVLVEYDGWQHERDPKQRQRDRERRERLEAEGWRVIVITSEDLRNKREIPWRVYEALKDRGYEGRQPHLNAMWDQWFN